MKIRALLCLGLMTPVLMGWLAPSVDAQQPAPASVLRWEKGCRYPQAGWIVLHIEGDPYERGVQLTCTTGDESLN